MYKRTIRQILSSDASSTIADIANLQSNVIERLMDYPLITRSKVPAVVSMPEAPLGLDPNLSDSDAIKRTCEALITGSDAPVSQTFGPEFLRLAPPLFNSDELIWFDPVGESDHMIAYDTTVCIPRGAGSEARRLIAQAFTGSLTLLQQNRLLSELERDSRLVYHVGITPNKVCYFLTYLFCSTLLNSRLKNYSFLPSSKTTP